MSELFGLLFCELLSHLDLGGDVSNAMLLETLLTYEKKFLYFFIISEE